MTAFETDSIKLSIALAGSIRSSDGEDIIKKLFRFKVGNAVKKH